MSEVYKILNIRSLEGEIWRNISCFQNYMCSNLGRIKSMPKEKVRLLVGNFTTKEQVLRQKITKWGYPSVTLYSKGQPIFKTVHRLILVKFQYV